MNRLLSCACLVSLLLLGGCASTAQVDDLNQQIDQLRSSIEAEQKQADEAAAAFARRLAEADAQLERLVAGQTRLLEANAEQIRQLADHGSRISSSVDQATQSATRLQEVMGDQNQRIADMVEIYNNRQFVHLTDLAGGKLETTILPKGAIGEFIVQGDRQLTTRGKDSNNRIGSLTVVGSGRWFINGKEYQYGDQMTFEVWVFEQLAHRSVEFWGREVTYAQSNGVMKSSLNEARPTGTDDLPAYFAVDGYTPGIETPFTVPHGTRIHLALDQDIKVVVK